MLKVEEEALPARSETQRLYFSERVVTLWNSLDDQCVTATSLNSFKNNLLRFRSLMGRSMDICVRCSSTLEAVNSAWPGELPGEYNSIVRYRL